MKTKMSNGKCYEWRVRDIEHWVGILGSELAKIKELSYEDERLLVFTLYKLDNYVIDAVAIARTLNRKEGKNE